MAAPLSLQPAFVSSILTVVLVSALVDCRPGPWDPEQRPSHMGRFYLELSGSVKNVKTDSSNFAPMLSLRRKRILCMDLKGELSTSRRRDKDCLSQHIWLDPMNHRRVFYSKSVGQLLKRSGARLQTVSLEPPGPSLVKRHRRSGDVNPSDPLRSQSHLSYFGRVHKDTTRGHPEQDQAGAVSKETISSCDDPLRVLQTSGPISPVKTNIAERAEKD
ncbi:hypothetical protein Q5P01_012151 [Channa striata]|uniref:Fibroblast growth factor 23 n=1 Tax=Channa striata TaxID=64152 RepID=A0AA88MRE9_CHASR|nr:hypothetical protein Q5P01_012151 [Channa striata]